MAIYSNKAPLILSDSEREKRTAPRKAFSGRAKIVISGQGAIQAQAMDLSVGGLSVIIDRKLQTGLFCGVGFNVPLHGTTHQITAIGEVRNCSVAGQDGFRIGLRFAEISPEHLDTITSYLG